MNVLEKENEMGYYNVLLTMYHSFIIVKSLWIKNLNNIVSNV